MKVRDDSWKTVMGKATAAGFATVVRCSVCDGLPCGCVDYVDPTTRLQLSSPFYLNVINQGSNFNEDWPFYYTVEPTSFEAPDGSGTQLTERQKETSVVGVEACMWSEWVDGSNFAGRFWPRAAAVAERGWSTKDTVSIDDFRRRVHSLTCELKARGLAAEPVVHGGR
jgi:hexosaminidase